MTSDEKIKKDVVDQLFWDGRVDASRVEVTVSDGNVTLIGEVENFAALQAAESDVISIPGVRAVENLLAVKYPHAEPPPSDAEIKTSIESVLKWNPYLDDSRIDIVVGKGIVKLTGTVDLYWKKEKTKRIAYDIFGVVKVIDQLGVVPTNDIADEVIAEEIAAALGRNTDIDEDKINIEVENGNVILSGSVPDWNAYRSAYETVLHTPGVTKLVNKLSIR